MVPEKVKSIKSKKLSSMMKKDEAPGKEYGAKPGEITLEEVNVSGNRPDLNKKKIYSDEYKAKRWHEIVRKTGENPSETRGNGNPWYDYETTEEMHKKEPGAIGKVNVMYSDGTIKKLGEPYQPSRLYATQTHRGTPMTASEDKLPLEGPIEKLVKPGIGGEAEDKVFGSRVSDWRQWHKDTYPEHYETKSKGKEVPEVKKIDAMKKP